jgi:tetratricopeptide (TPR) repeat protein
VARLYNNIAVAWEKKCEYVKALAYYEKSLAIDLITLGETHSSIYNLYKKIVKCHYNLKEYAIALELFTKGFNTFKNGE